MWNSTVTLEKYCFMPFRKFFIKLKFIPSKPRLFELSHSYTTRQTSSSVNSLTKSIFFAPSILLTCILWVCLTPLTEKWLWKWSKNAFLISFTYVILMSFISKHKISLFFSTCSHTRGNILLVSPSFSHLDLAFCHWKLQLRFKSLCIIIESYL